jgi:hypothetical protein
MVIELENLISAELPLWATVPERDRLQPPTFGLEAGSGLLNGLVLPAYDALERAVQIAGG